jgi:acetylornithine deacetylase/succinyl-diaminopimelate desuccinylase-like protein
VGIAFLLAAAGALWADGGAGAEATDLRQRVRGYRGAHEAAIVHELADLVALPNLASDSIGIRRNAAYLATMLGRRGIPARLLELKGAPPAIYGEIVTPGAQRTIVLYAHYDGQPVDVSQWKSSPWKPVLRDASLDAGGKDVVWNFADTTHAGPIPGDWRLYARSASDDKAPIVAMLVALDALRAARVQPSVNVKLLFEGEEEAGSPHLEEMIHQNAKLLAADALIFCDGPVHQTRRMLVFFGARGVVDVEMTVYGALRALHSGHYGNWAPNPIVALSRIVASMRDTDARILIPDYYDDVRPLTKVEQRAVDASPEVENQLRHDLGLAWNEGGEERLAERILQPAINLRGIQGGGVGDKAANAIPTEARASIDFRLVPDQTPDHVRELVEAHIENQGFNIVHETPGLEMRRNRSGLVKLEWGKGYPPARTPMDLPVSKAVVSVMREVVGDSLVVLPSLGGSVPMYVFEKGLGAPVIGLPIVNHDNNQHAADENLRLQNLWDGIEIFSALLARLGETWR